MEQKNIKIISPVWIFLRKAEPIILIIVILTLIYFIMLIKTDGAKCQANPLIYGANVIYLSNQQNIDCICSIRENPNYLYEFNRTGWFEVLNKLETNSKQINWSKLKT
jgi:hypothetical protein